MYEHHKIGHPVRKEHNRDENGVVYCADIMQVCIHKIQDMLKILEEEKEPLAEFMVKETRNFIEFIKGDIYAGEI